MKNIYALVFLVVLLILVVCIWETTKHQKTIAKTVRSILVMGVVATAANVTLMLTEHLVIGDVAYSVFFCSIGWLLFFLLQYAHQYTGGTGNYLGFKWLLGIVLLIDNICMFSNLYFHQVFDLEIKTWRGDNYITAIHKPLYNWHLGLSYLIVAMFFVLLIRKIIKSPSLYRKKYKYICWSMLFVILADAVFVFSGMEVDFSIIIYAVAGIIIYYYSLIYMPNDLINTALFMVVEDMADGILLFDMDGSCLYQSKSAKELLLDQDGNQLDVEKRFDSWCQDCPPKDRSNFVRESTEQKGSERLRIKISFNKLLDDKQNYMGCYFVLENRTKEYREMQEKRYLTTHDSLTGLYNKAYFYEKVREKINEHPQEEYIMLCSNVSRFKMVNDIFGDKAGDDLLIRLAEEIKRHAEVDMVYGRLESDRFAIFMKRESYSEQFYIHRTWEAIRINGGTYPIQNCIGVYMIKDNSMSISGMCDRASMAITTIKGSYDKSIVYYDNKLRDNIVREQMLISQLQEAIDKEQFEIFLQPQVTYYGKGKSELCGVEALVRWRHQKGLITPGEFIQVFEQNGVITKLDLHVWELACKQLQKWKRENRTDIIMSVNISPRDFYFTDIYRVFTQLIKDYEISPENLRLEITETAIMLDVEKQVALIGRLQNAGFTVVMDDFGSGYSSLNTLKEIPVNGIKIDMKFLEKGNDASRSKNILRTIVSMAKNLELDVITEGVENKAQADFVESIGCSKIQGYYFGKPMQIHDFEEKYLKIKE